MTFTVRQAIPADARGYIALIKSILRENPPVDTPYAPDEFDPPLIDLPNTKIVDAMVGVEHGISQHIWRDLHPRPASMRTVPSISSTSTLAPPCKGPQRAQTPAAQEAKRLALLEPTMRTVEVEQFCS